MDKSVKWKSDIVGKSKSFASTPKSETSESPSLSDKQPQPLKRKRSSIFSRLRKSIFLNPSEDADSKPISTENDNLALKRTVSLDAGLQKRISQLTPNETNDSNSREDSIIEDHSTSDALKRKSSLKRSKSLVASFIEPLFIDSSTITEDIKVVGSQLPSPTENSNTLNRDETMNICDSFNLNLDNDPLAVAAKSLHPLDGQQIQVSIARVFNCVWLAPTRKFHSFPGNLYLLPSETIMFYSNSSSDRVVRLQFNLSDILNISRGSWNGQHDQALIIDLIQGKRRSWVFVGWKQGEFRESVEAIVEQWMKVVNSKIRNQLHSKRIQLNQKYCRLIKASGVADSTIEFGVKANCKLLSDSYLPLERIYKYFKGFYSKLIQRQARTHKKSDEPKNVVTLPLVHKFASFRNVLLDRTVAHVTPQILTQILTDQATNFMENFRTIQGIILHSDSGWQDEVGEREKNSGRLYEGESRSFSIVLTSSKTSSLQKKKWRVIESIMKSSPELVIFDLFLQPQADEDEIESSGFKFKIRYEICRELKLNENDLTRNELVVNDSLLHNNEFNCNVKISAEIDFNESSIVLGGSTIVKSNSSHLNLKMKRIEQNLCKYYRDFYFPQLFNLLPSMLEDAQFDFDSQLGIQELFVPPPHYRFIKYRLKELFLKAQLYVTVWLLPILYKSKSLKYLKFASITILPTLYIFYLFYHLYTNRSSIEYYDFT